MRFQYPVSGTFTDGFNPDRGYVPGVGNVGSHTGQDIAAPAGTPIVAAADGVVVRVWFDRFVNGSPAGGNMVAIEHGNGWESRYAHMQSTALVRVGQRVVAGQLVGRVGMTGAANGNHVHYEILYRGVFVDPAKHSSYTPTEMELEELFYLILQKKHTYLVTPQGSAKPRAVLMGSEGSGAGMSPLLPVIHAHSAAFTASDLAKAISGIRAAHLKGFQ